MQVLVSEVAKYTLDMFTLNFVAALHTSRVIPDLGIWLHFSHFASAFTEVGIAPISETNRQAISFLAQIVGSQMESATIFSDAYRAREQDERRSNCNSVLATIDDASNPYLLYLLRSRIAHRTFHT